MVWVQREDSAEGGMLASCFWLCLWEGVGAMSTGPHTGGDRWSPYAGPSLRPELPNPMNHAPWPQRRRELARAVPEPHPPGIEHGRSERVARAAGATAKRNSARLFSVE